MHDEDYPARLGGAAIGARLRRLSARIDADAARAYAAFGVAFEQRWFGVLNQLALIGPMSVTGLAAALGISHASVSETKASLEAMGLIVSRPDAADGRRRTLQLSEDGQAFVARLRPLWQAFDAAAAELDVEAGQVSDALGRLEAALERTSLLARILARAPDAYPRPTRSSIA